MSEMRAVADDGLATAPIRPLSRFGAGLDGGLRVIMALAVSGELAAIFMNVVLVICSTVPSCGSMTSRRSPFPS